MKKILNDSKKLTRARVWLLTPNPLNLEVWFKKLKNATTAKVKSSN